MVSLCHILVQDQLSALNHRLDPSSGWTRLSQHNSILPPLSYSPHSPMQAASGCHGPAPSRGCSHPAEALATALGQAGAGKDTAQSKCLSDNIVSAGRGKNSGQPPTHRKCSQDKLAMDQTRDAELGRDWQIKMGERRPKEPRRC